ncbi:MAG: hypothetical protein RBU27_14355, partial [Bacteroidota bacterium]|nr:hypothetical protein [Bacteroidota bacterium]
MKRTASVILVVFAMQSLPVVAQVTAHIWKADTIWYYTQIDGFLPDRIAPVVSIVNRGSDTAYQVSLTCEGQTYLRFPDGSVSSTAVPVARLAPGDSLRQPVVVNVRGDRYQANIPWPQRLFWQLDWEQGAARERRANEGHAIAMLLGSCPGGDGRDERKGLEIIVPDTLILDPGPDGQQRRELELHCLVYSKEGLPLVVDNVTLDRDWPEEPIARTEIHRLTPE